MGDEDGKIYRHHQDRLEEYIVDRAEKGKRIQERYREGSACRIELAHRGIACIDRSWIMIQIEICRNIKDPHI